MKRTLSVILLLAMAATISCGSSGASESTTAADTTTIGEAVDPLMPTETASYNGREFTIVSYPNIMTSVYSEQMDGSLLNDAVFERNQKVEDELDVNIKFHNAEDGAYLYNTVKTSIMAGDNNFDLIVSHVNIDLTKYVSDNLVIDWNTVPHVDFSKPYWNGSIMDMLTINGKSPYAASDVFVADTVFMLYNKKLASDLGLGNLYDMVYDGSWTWDKLAKISADVSTDINGDGNMDENDRYGIAIDIKGSRWLLRNIPSSCGQMVYENGKNGLKLIVNNEKTLSVLEKICALFNGGGGFLRGGSGPSDGSEIKLFDQGNYLTWIVSLSNASLKYSNLSFDYGVLPLPKYDEKQENYSTLSWSNNLMIPTTADADFTGMVTEWMSYYGYKLVRPKFYDTLMSVRFAQDEQTVDMLDMIFSSITYDPGMSFKSQSFYSYFDTMVVDNNTDFASYYDSSLSSEEAYIEGLNEAFANFGK